jgi:hypothetical protein
MTDTFRALCAELVSEIQALRRAVADEVGCSLPEPSVIARARAALAQPEPVWTEGICGDGAAILKDGVMQPIEDVIAALNATALAQPEPQGPTDEELWDLYQDLGSYFSPTEFARTVLARWGNR